MKFIGILFVFFGYVLVYASAAAGGKFATEPWAGLFADAYTDANTTSPIAAGIASVTPTGPTTTPSRPRISLPQTKPVYSGTHGGSYGAQP